MSSSKYLVFGAGLAGAATLWQPARRGHEVTLVERSHPAADLPRRSAVTPLEGSPEVLVDPGVGERVPVGVGDELVAPVAAVEGEGQVPECTAAVAVRTAAAGGVDVDTKPVGDSGWDGAGCGDRVGEHPAKQV